MSKIRTLILRAPGTNCDGETAFAFEKAGADTTLAHVNKLIRREETLADYQIMVIPGGFTYGDDIAAGKVLEDFSQLGIKTVWILVRTPDTATKELTMVSATVRKTSN